MKGGFTIIEVFQELGYETKPNETWSAGARLREIYAAEVGSLPIKALRPKTSGGGGTHCFAVYPPEWRDRARQIVRELATERDRQGDLFGSGSERR